MSVFLTALATDVASTVTQEVGALRTILNNLVGDISLSKLISAVLLLIICTFCIKLLMKTVQNMLSRSKVEKTIHTIVLSFTKILLIFLAIMLVAGSLGIDTSSLLAILSVAGLAASLALQDSLSNLASGVVILLSKPFKDGDYVTVGGFSGTVQEIGITYTKLLTVDNQAILVPNRTITASSIANYSAEENRRLDLTFTASYDAPTETVKAALAEAVDIPQVLKDQPVFIRVSKYGDSSIEYTVRVWVRNGDYWDAHFEIMERVRNCFQAHGVEMTYPHLNIHAAS